MESTSKSRKHIIFKKTNSMTAQDDVSTAIVSFLPDVSNIQFTSPPRNYGVMSNILRFLRITIYGTG